MRDSDLDPPVFDISRITFASQDGIAQFESVAREFLPAVLNLDYDETMITDESSLGDFCGWLETRGEFDAWEQQVLQRIEDRYGVRPPATNILLVDLFRDVELQRRPSTRQWTGGRGLSGEESGRRCSFASSSRRGAAPRIGLAAGSGQGSDS